MSKANIYTLPLILLTMLFLSCKRSIGETISIAEEVMDSLRSESFAVYLELPEQNLVIYKGTSADYMSSSIPYTFNLNLLNTSTGDIDTIKCGGNDYVAEILKGKTEETVSVITCGGSGGYCSISVIDLALKKEILCKELETNFFEFQEYIPEGYKGTCYIRTYDDRYGVGYNTAIDFDGNTLYMNEILPE